MPYGLSVAIWNTEWRPPGSPPGKRIREILQQGGFDLICLTEGCEGLLPPQGYIVTSGADYGYGVQAQRRKVLIWSRCPWREIDQVGHGDLPSGRFVSALTETPIGPLRFVGVCVSWKDAHVRTGRRDRTPWEDHRAYLKALGTLLPDCAASGRLVVAGDFNQTVPRLRVPPAVHDSLQRALGGLEIATANYTLPSGRLSIDHLAYTPDLSATAIASWSNLSEDGSRLSDHCGLSVRLSLRDASGPSTESGER